VHDVQQQRWCDRAGAGPGMDRSLTLGKLRTIFGEMSDNIIKSQARVSDPKFQYLSSSGQQGLVGRLGRRRAALVSGVRSRVSGGRGRGCRLAFSVNLTLNLTLYFFGPQSNLVQRRNVELSIEKKCGATDATVYTACR